MCPVRKFRHKKLRYFRIFKPQVGTWNESYRLHFHRKLRKLQLGFLFSGKSLLLTRKIMSSDRLKLLPLQKRRGSQTKHSMTTISINESNSALLQFSDSAVDFSRFMCCTSRPDIKFYILTLHFLYIQIN